MEGKKEGGGREGGRKEGRGKEKERKKEGREGERKGGREALLRHVKIEGEKRKLIPFPVVSKNLSLD